MVLCIRHVYINCCYPLGPVIASKCRCLITDQVVHRWCHHFSAMLPGFHCCYLVCQWDVTCSVCKRVAKMHQSASPCLSIISLHVYDLMKSWTDLFEILCWQNRMNVPELPHCAYNFWLAIWYSSTDFQKCLYRWHRTMVYLLFSFFSLTNMYLSLF